MNYAEQTETTLLDEQLAEAQMERVDELERRLITVQQENQALKQRVLVLESKAGIASENQYGLGKTLAAEAEQDQPAERHDPQALSAEEYAGVPLASPMDLRRSMLTEDVLPAGVFEGRVLMEGQRRRLLLDEEGNEVDSRELANW